ncbi:MAG: hypothetical protein ACOVME_08470 [Rhodobacter sp.]
MNKLWLVVIAAVVAIGAYYQFSYVPAQRAAQEAAAAAEAAAAKAAEEAAAAAKAADAVTDAATGAVDAVTGAATGAGAAVGEAVSWVWDATKLSSEEITERIASAPISQSVKDTLTATYNSVKDSPAAVQGVLDQLKQAMGL